MGRYNSILDVIEVAGGRIINNSGVSAEMTVDIPPTLEANVCESFYCYMFMHIYPSGGSVNAKLLVSGVSVGTTFAVAPVFSTDAYLIVGGSSVNTATNTVANSNWKGFI